MAKKIAGARKTKTKKSVKRSRLSEDLMASLEELRDYVAGKPTKVIVHTVIPATPTRGWRDTNSVCRSANSRR
jgi:hypothetical protein